MCICLSQFVISSRKNEFVHLLSLFLLKNIIISLALLLCKLQLQILILLFSVYKNFNISKEKESNFTETVFSKFLSFIKDKKVLASSNVEILISYL